MRLEEQYIPPASKLMADYINGEGPIRQYFSYEPEKAAFEARYEKLKTHSVDRGKLSGILKRYMAPHGISEAANHHLESFENGAPVVVTGQQAGLLTGPLYTIHKAISVVILAKEASEQLNTPVVPVFWIAGEDHDLAEISHLYREVNGRVDKLNFPHTEYGKKTASTAVLNKTKIKSYLEEYFRSFPETEYSKEIQQISLSFLEKSQSFTDFFACFLNYFFQQEGLLYIDAAFPELRQYESPFFEQMIHQSEEIAKSVAETEEDLVGNGYGAAIEAQADAANLFVTIKGERILLEREGQDFKGNNGAVIFTKAELLDLARTDPEALSNNVVTRPIMQELVFPVLSFVGGPGEIAYWAALKGAFSVMGMEMPVVMPRLNMTVVNRQVQTLMSKYQLSFSDILIDRRVPEMRNALIEATREKEAEALLDGLAEKLKTDYEEIHQKYSAVSKGLTPLVEKNLEFHLKQVDFLKHKLQDEVLLQNAIEFNHFACIENGLQPNGSFQERIYSPYPFLNDYGSSLVQDMMKLNFKYDKNHKIIYL